MQRDRVSLLLEARKHGMQVAGSNVIIVISYSHVHFNSLRLYMVMTVFIAKLALECQTDVNQTATSSLHRQEITVGECRGMKRALRCMMMNK